VSRPKAPDPYPDISRWCIPATAIELTLEAIRPSGHPGVEAGTFWLGRRETTSRVEAVVIPAGEGVDQMQGCWRVSSEVYGRVSRWAVTRGFSLLAVCHTHEGPSPARLSRRDRTHSVKAPGILAVVVGCNGGEADWMRWGWYVWHGDDYQHVNASDLLRAVHIDNGQATAWRVDATGIFPA
jgi:hypothetical protein